MFDWLRRKIKRWMLEDERPLPRLECRMPGGGGTITFHVTGSSGLKLWGTARSSDGLQVMRLVGEAEACDRNHFWRLWKTYNKDGLHWGDGVAFDPGRCDVQ